MTAFLWLGLALAAVLVVMLGMVAWRDDQADAERRQRLEEEFWRHREQYRERKR